MIARFFCATVPTLLLTIFLQVTLPLPRKNVDFGAREVRK